jgi:hypothetical protein
MEIVARAVITFAFLFLITRGLPRRTLADMAPFEMLLLVTLGDIVQQGITQEDYSAHRQRARREHVRRVGTAALLRHVALAAGGASGRGRTAGDRARRRPARRTPCASSDSPLDEVMEAARQQGIADLSSVRLAILEPNGRISFLKAEG